MIFSLPMLALYIINFLKNKKGTRILNCLELKSNSTVSNPKK